MSTTSITSGTNFIGKTLIIGSTGTSNTNYARVVEFNNTTATYLGVEFATANQNPRFSFRPIGQTYTEPIMPWTSYINVYYIYVFSFISDIQVKYNIYEYNGASTIVSKGTIYTYNAASAYLQNLTQFWLGRSIWGNDFYNGRYDKVTLYNGDLFALNDANILSTLLTLVTSTQTNIINNNTYTFRSVGTNFLGVVVNILNYNTTSGSSVTNSNITLNGTTNISGGYLNIIGSYIEPAAPSIIMHNFNSSNKSWKMYAHTLSSISGDNLTIKPSVGKNILLEVSANNAIFIKQGDVSYNLSNLTNSISNITTSVTSGGTITATISPFGQEIFGEETNTYSGYNVSLSEDGTIMGITAPFNNGTGTLQGSARIYKYNDISWVQLGKDIDGEANNDYQATIKLSKDGTIVALGSFFNSGTGSVRVFKYNNIDISWIKQGQDIDGIGAGDEFARSISLSANGKIIAIGALYNDTSYYNAGQVLVYSYNDVSWNKIGTFNGFYEEAYTGFSVSLSSSGTILAISSLPSETSTFIPRVDIYELTNNVWSPKGPTIYSSYTSGNGGSRYGRIIELSSDGTIVAINDRFLQSTNYGRVLVYKYTNSDNSWNRLGSDISGPVVSLNEDLDPYIALSADGTIMAVGYVSDNTFKGLVRLYKFSNNNWIKIGTDLSGDNAQDRFGFSLALSSNGSILSVGSIFYPPNNIGRVKTYNVTYSVSNSVTTTIYNIKDASFSNIDISGNLNPLIVNGSSIGLATKNWNSAYINNIYGETLNTSHYSQRFGNSLLNIIGQDISNGPPLANNNNKIAISNDGRVVALSSSSHSDISKGRVYVYEISYNQVAYNWTRLGLSSEIIVGLSNDDQFGWDIALSSNGKVVAGSSILNDTSGTNCGQVRVFELSNNNLWRQKGSAINGPRANSESGYSISLAGNGNSIAIGAWKDNSNGSNAGAVRVYDFSAAISDWRQQGQGIFGVSGSYEGYATALSLDGLTLATGCLNVNNANNVINAGQVKTFTWSGTAWTNKGIIQGPDISYLYFGRALKLSANGNAIVIGAPTSSTGSGGGGGATGWTYNAWTNDASTGLDANSSYTVAVNLGEGDIATTVNQVSFQAHALSGTNFSIGGAVASYGSPTQNISGAGVALASNFIYNANSRTITLTNLTYGATYKTSIFSIGWDTTSMRNQIFTAVNGPSITIDPNIYGQYMGIIINCTFVADYTGSQVFTINAVNSGVTFILSALANRLISSPNISPTDLSYRYNQGSAWVYGYIGGTSWTQTGQAITGISGDELGTNVSMSNDGSIIVIGGRSSADNNFRCNIQFFKNINNNWIKLGQTINGSVNNSIIAYNHALSGDGTTLLHNLGNQSSRVYGSDKTLAINSNISTISGDLITSGNINPLNTNGSSLGLPSKIWGNAYIRDVSVTSIDISGHIICPRDISINIGSSLRRWRNVFSDDLSVNKINGQVYSGSSSIVLTSVSGDIIPSSNNLFKLGDISRNWSNAYIRDLSISSIDISQNLNPLTNNGASLGLLNKLWGNAYLRDASVSSIDVSTNLNPLTNNGSSLGLISQTWGNAYIRDVSISYIDVSQNLNPLTNNGSSLGLPGKYWGNAYLRDISISSIDVSVNSINPFLNNSASLGAPSKTWGNAYIRDLSVSSIDVSGNLNPLTTNTLTLGIPSKVWGNAYIRDISISSIDVSINSINPFLNNGSGLGLVTKTWSNAYLRDASVSSIDISQNLNPLVSGSSTVSIAQGTGGTVTISGGYIIHSFTTVGTSIFRPSSNGSVEVLIVGGGGGGGGRLGGGGGGGGVIWIPSVNVSSDTSYSIVVGDGGTTLNNGQNSSAFGATGAGGGSSGVHDSGDGTAGGSGGGAASNNSRLNIGGGTSGNILGTNNGFIYGCSGGNMTTARTGGPTRAAGGGGAGGPGLNTNSNVTGDTGRTGMGSGGVGIVNAILGPSYYWAGGGGGGGYVDQTGGYGGLGGGGGAGSNGPIGIGGGSSLNSGVDGFGLDGGAGGPNTGGGGGGCGWVSEAGGKGGSGIVVIRYLQGTSGSSGSNLGSSLKRWKNIFVGDLSVNTINGLAYSSGGGGGAASIVYSAGGSSIVNSAIVSNMIPSLTNTYSLGSTTNYWNNAYIRDLSLSNRAYQEISGDISWTAVNGYYGLAKDAYPSLNPRSSGAKAAIGMTVTTRFTWGMSGICWSPQLLIFVGVGWQRSTWSTDGKIWNEVILGNQNTLLNSGWYSVCWSPELLLFVAVADNGRVMRSTNGKNWTFSVEFSIALWIDVCWSPELFLFVAVGFSGTGNRVITSRDGINWTRQTGIPDYSWMAICWSPELRIFAVLSAGGNASMISSNGINWTYNSTPNVQAMRGICWSPELGIFVGVGGNPPGNSMISNNGINWTSYIMPWGSSGSPWKVSWSPQLKLFVVPNNYAGGIFIATSTDGKVWNIITYTGVYKEYPNITWSPELGIFVCLSNSGGDGAIHTALVSSLKGRPPTSYNLFDSCFNRIDENGKWDFSNIAISGTMTAGATNVTSDDRLKHNEVIIANGLAVIDQLRPKFYQKTQNMLDASYNGDLSEHVWTYEAGLIAQEVLQIPDLSFVVSGGDYYETVMNYELSYNDLSINDVSINDLRITDLSINDLSYTIIYYESGKYLISQKYTLNYNSIITYGIAAIKELHAKVKAQDISLLEQHATINSLLTRLQALDPSAN